MNNMYTFSHKKNTNSLANSVFKICNNVHNWSICFARDHEYLRQQNIFWYNGILYIHETNIPNLFNGLLQLKDLISNNVKMSK